MMISSCRRSAHLLLNITDYESSYRLGRAFVGCKDGIGFDVDSIQSFGRGSEGVKSSKAKKFYPTRNQYQRLVYYNEEYFTVLLIEYIESGGGKRERVRNMEESIQGNNTRVVLEYYC